MEVIKINTLLSEVKPRMQNIEVKAKGYVTEEKTIKCQILEHCATSGGNEKVEYYVNEKGQLFSIHFAHRLDLRYSVCAIDFFMTYTKNDIEKVAAIILKEIRSKV